MRSEEVLGLAMAVWTSLLLLVVPAGSADVFVILLLIGLLVARALVGPYAAAGTNVRVDAFIALGLVVFAVFVVRRVYDVLTT